MLRGCLLGCWGVLLVLLLLVVLVVVLLLLALHLCLAQQEVHPLRGEGVAIGLAVGARACWEGLGEQEQGSGRGRGVGRER